MSIIYCYTNILNGKKYVGQTINPEQRKQAHKSEAFNEKAPQYNSPFHRAIRKYGLENFNYEILAEVENPKELDDLEIYYIKFFNTQIHNGYNIKPGGEGGSYPCSPEAKEKLMWNHGMLSEEEVIFLRKAYAEKKSPSKIYNELYKDKMHYNSFLNIWTGQRYKTVMPEVFTQKKRHTKLTEEIVKNIRLDREINKISYDLLAKKYNISKSTIADICKYRTWKNI